jgi:hypothetical protein
MQICLGLQIVVLIVLFAAMGGWLCPFKAIYIAAAVLTVSLILPHQGHHQAQ